MAFADTGNPHCKVIDAPQQCYDTQYVPPQDPPHGQVRCLAILVDEDLMGTILSLQCLIYNVGEEGRRGEVPDSHFYSIPIQLVKGYNVIWWEDNEIFQHNSQTTGWGSYPFTISFPALQTSHFLLSDTGLYLPHPEQVSYIYAPGELNPPALTRVRCSSTPPSLLHSSLIAAGLLIKAYPSLNSGLIGSKRTPTFIQLDLFNARDRIPILLSRHWGGRG